MTESRVIVGVGMSTHATRDEIATLIRDTMRHYGFSAPPFAIATRAAFADDERLQLGCTVIGIDERELIAHSEPVDRAIGIPARVAETAAALAAGPTGRLAGPSRCSVHATAAVAVADVGTADAVEGVGGVTP